MLQNLTPKIVFVPLAILALLWGGLFVGDAGWRSTLTWSSHKVQATITGADSTTRHCGRSARSNSGVRHSTVHEIIYRFSWDAGTRKRNGTFQECSDGGDYEIGQKLSLYVGSNGAATSMSPFFAYVIGIFLYVLMVGGALILRGRSIPQVLIGAMDRARRG